MKIFFQSKKFDSHALLKQFSYNNKKSGSIISFTGQVRPSRNKKKVTSIDIELYEKMAYIQTKKITKKIVKQKKIDDFLIVHRYGRLYPEENIIFIAAASEHRAEGFFFTQEIILWFKKKITFWKKENFKLSSNWVESDSLNK